MKKIACFPGSFDPFTKGHEDIIRKGLNLFDEIVIAVGVNSNKNYLFPLENRLKHIKSCFENNPKIRVITYQKLTVDMCREEGCNYILRGLRDVKDFNYEVPIALMNRSMTEIETIFLIPDTSLFAINATIIREIYKNGGKIDKYVTNFEQLVN
ncbi:pantetheine-phosphate adenylyltransferase [Fluviicola sp.]|jgi:pantetheine-phosphate adenylyltransferase|uniref:pantetheine-phosphate adenylyltransferase n=1 Tax=Fluviicola sp. TaxID=1917219 RepID=UPI0028303D1B|nr:pantetheine-phosphate adenylyltransferase [Fluviicola sp.]MDR0802483.1 pantetheine-phosphate adenylyltransferase [Fluviicola sp.]